MQPKNGHVGPSTDSKKDFSVVATTERERVSFFAEGVIFLRPFSCQGLLGVSAFFKFILNFILIFFFDY